MPKKTIKKTSVPPKVPVKKSAPSPISQGFLIAGKKRIRLSSVDLYHASAGKLIISLSSGAVVECPDLGCMVQDLDKHFKLT